MLLNAVEGYSPANTPHLTPALELDNAMIDFSVSLAANGLPTTVASAQDVDTLMSAFEAHLGKLDFWQYYVLDVKAERESLPLPDTSMSFRMHADQATRNGYAAATTVDGDMRIYFWTCECSNLP